MRIAFLSDKSEASRSALSSLRGGVDESPPTRSDVIVVLGGDGLMLQTMHRFGSRGVPLYGMNLGSAGFLMNEFRVDDLVGRIRRSAATPIHPLRMTARDVGGRRYRALAFNEISLLRSSSQAARIRVEVDGHPRLESLMCDGVLASTPAGSTAYNLSAHGPILPIGSSLIGLTPISSFRPRRWRGAILSADARITFRVLDIEKRPVIAAADNRQFSSVEIVSAVLASSCAATLLFDPGHTLEERVLREQFLS